MSERLNQTELAKKLNKSKAYITQLKKNKKLVFGSDNKITLEEALNQLSKSSERVNNLVNKNTKLVNSLPNAKKSDISTNPDDEEDTLTYWKKENEKLVHRLKTLDLLQEEKQLIKIEEVQKEIEEIAHVLKASLMTVADRLYTQVSAESDPLKCRDMINDEISLILNEVADKLESVKDRE